MTKRIYYFNIFKKMFPDLAEHAVNYRKIGSKMIAVQMDDGQSLVFLYINEKNWSLGTKPWRRRPEPVKKSEAMDKLNPMEPGQDVTEE